MMLPRILWDHASQRVQNTNVTSALSARNHQARLYTKNTLKLFYDVGRVAPEVLLNKSGKPRHPERSEGSPESGSVTESGDPSLRSK